MAALGHRGTQDGEEGRGGERRGEERRGEENEDSLSRTDWVAVTFMNLLFFRFKLPKTVTVTTL